MANDGSAIRFVNTIVFVADLARSAAFYRDVLGQRVEHDWGSILIFEGGWAIHDGRDLYAKVYKRAAEAATSGEPFGRDNLDIYFETDDLAGAFERVVAAGADVIHPIETQPWGQRVFRVHDPDGHIVEIGEPL